MMIDAARALRFDRGSANNAALVCFLARQDTTVVLAIDNVVDYVDACFTDAGKVMDLQHDLPTVAPLGPAMWLEWQGYAVLLYVAIEGQDERDALRASGRKQGLRGLAGAMPDDAHWCYLAFVCTSEGQDGPLSLLPVSRGLYARRDGALLPQQYSCTHLEETDPGLASRSELTTLLVLALMALCFTHCKNVRLGEHRPSRQRRRAAERAGRPPLVTYKTIDIVPVTRLLHDEGQVETVGLKTALHLVRGHFAHYGPGHYFGRNPEPVTVFRPLHVRGSPEAGVVAKDYRVLTGERIDAQP